MDFDARGQPVVYVADLLGLDHGVSLEVQQDDVGG